jgi:hypothetical protein
MGKEEQEEGVSSYWMTLMEKSILEIEGSVLSCRCRGLVTHPVYFRG